MAHTPATLLPGPEGLPWLVHESPSFRLIFTERVGFAAARDLAEMLWPTTDPEIPCRDLGRQTPERYLASLLDELALDDDSAIVKQGPFSYCASRPEGERPWWLPRWPAHATMFTPDEERT
jgi:hypothetical protein